VTPWTVAHQSPCPWEFSGKCTGVGCHFSSPRDLPDPGTKPTSAVSPVFQVDSLSDEPLGSLLKQMVKTFKIQCLSKFQIHIVLLTIVTIIRSSEIFLPRSKCLLISWLQSPSAVILEPPKIKSDTVSTVSPSISHEVMGPDAMIFVF